MHEDHSEVLGFFVMKSLFFSFHCISLGRFSEKDLIIPVVFRVSYKVGVGRPETLGGCLTGDTDERKASRTAGTGLYWYCGLWTGLGHGMAISQHSKRSPRGQ